MGRDDGLNNPGDKVEVRPYHPDDLNAFLDAWEAASRLAHPFMSDEMIAEQRISIEKKHLPDTVTDLALIDGKLERFISMLGNVVGAMYVDPAFHKKGVGRAQLGIPKAIHETLEVDVYEKASAVRAFYEKHAFSEISRSSPGALGGVALRMRFSNCD